MLLAGNRVQKVCERLHILSPELIDAMGIAHIYVCMARCDRRSFFKSFDVSFVGKLLWNCNVPILVSFTTMFSLACTCITVKVLTAKTTASMILSVLFIIFSPFLTVAYLHVQPCPGQLRSMAHSSAALDHFNFTISSGIQVWSKNSIPLP